MYELAVITIGGGYLIITPEICSIVITFKQFVALLTHSLSGIYLEVVVKH